MLHGTTPWSARASMLARIGLCIAAGVMCGVVGNLLHPAGVPLLRPVWAQAEVGQCSAGAEPGPGIPPMAVPQQIVPQQVAGLRDARNLVIGDLRAPRQYAEGHIAGAIHLPCAGALGQEALARIPTGARLLLYDADGRSTDLQTAAVTAAIRGVAGVYLLQGGFSAWLAAGLPAESGICENCAQR